MSVCGICDGLLQRKGEPLTFSGHLNVWSCKECKPILDTIPPKGPDDGQEE